MTPDQTREALLDVISALTLPNSSGDDDLEPALARHEAAVKAEALREVVEEMNVIVSNGDVAECAAYVPGEVGRSKAIEARDELMDFECMTNWVHARADRIEKDARS